MLKIERDLHLLKVERLFFGNDLMANIYEPLFSTIIPQKKNRDLSDPRSQTLSGEDSTWMVDRLEIPRIVDFLLLVFSFFYYMIK